MGAELTGSGVWITVMRYTPTSSPLASWSHQTTARPSASDSRREPRWTTATAHWNAPLPATTRTGSTTQLALGGCETGCRMDVWVLASTGQSRWQTRGPTLCRASRGEDCGSSTVLEANTDDGLGQRWRRSTTARRMREWGRNGSWIREGRLYAAEEMRPPRNSRNPLPNCCPDFPRALW